MDVKGQTKDQVIDNFIRSDEFVDKYGYTPGINEAPAVTDASETYGGGDASTNYITDQAAYEAEQTSRAEDITHSTTSASLDADDYLNAYANLTATADNTAAETVASTNAVTDATTSAAINNQQTNTVDEWLTDFYEEHGINDGKVDEEGRTYWTGELASGNKTVDEVENDILYAAANNDISTPTVAQPTSTTTDSTGASSDWLQDAYTAAGLGTVDAGGRAYWLSLIHI